MRSFESQNQRVEEEHMIAKALERANVVLSAEAIDPASFKDFYDSDMVEHDIQRARTLVERFQSQQTPEGERNKNLATVFEAIMHEQIELSDWLGPTASTVKPSAYDDYYNGVDTVVEFADESNSFSHLALAIDVTYTSSVEKKFQRIKDEIDKGETATVKYYHSQEMGFRGQLTKIPRVVIGAEPKTIHRLIEAWLEKKHSDLANDPIQQQIIEELEMQLVAFRAYAESKNQTDLLPMYDRALATIQAIKAEKSTTKTGKHASDRVFQSIQEEISMFADK